MGCKYCNKTEENNDIDFPTKASLKFNKQFDNFLTETESEKLTNDEFDKNIPENYLNYSNEHVFNLPPELKEKKDLHSVQPIKFKNGNIFKGKWNNESRMEETTGVCGIWNPPSRVILGRSIHGGLAEAKSQEDEQDWAAENKHHSVRGLPVI